MKRKLTFFLLLSCALLLTACGVRDDGDEIYELPPEPEEGVLIYAALNPPAGTTQNRVDRFNESHTDVQIEIRDYSDEGGTERLLLELAAGRVPDLIELHQFGEAGEVERYGVPVSSAPAEDEYWMPYRQMAQRGYLEDLWPYIENDPELGRDAVLEALLKAAEVDGGLYMLFRDVWITTLMGPEWAVGDRTGWTFEELMEAFSAMPEDSTILRYDATRWDVYSRLLSFTLSRYVDWDTGRTSFDSQGFRNMLAFLKAFPAEFETPLTPEQVEEEIIWRIRSGRQMLEGTVVSLMKDICYKDAFWEGSAAFVGYPTADGESGHMLNLRGTVLCMSSACRNKEAAWDYLRQLVTSHYNRGTMDKAHRSGNIYIPVNRADYELGNQVDLARGRQIDLEKDPEAMPPWKPFSSRLIEIFPQHPPSEEDLRRFDALVNSTAQIYWPDNALSDIVWDAAGPYFAGDKTLDETIRLIENRVKLYVNEQK